MAIPHAVPGDVIDVRPLGTALASTKSHALFKSRELELMRIVLRAGEELPPHAVSGELTLHCLEGKVAFSGASGVRELAAGQLVYAAGHEQHALRAIEDASLLLTVALNKAPGS